MIHHIITAMATAMSCLKVAAKKGRVRTKFMLIIECQVKIKTANCMGMNNSL